METAKTALVIGGGVAGLQTALKIGMAGYKVILAEKESDPGGVLTQLYSSFPRWENPSDLIDYLIDQITQCPLITIMTGTRVISSQKQGGTFTVGLKSVDGKTQEIKVNAVVIATGFELFDASTYGEYGYGTYENVYTSLEFEAQLREWAEGRDKNHPQTVAFFKCVGSRDNSKGYPYCSKICCMYTAKQAGQVKDLFPDAKCYVFYMDYRAAGKEYEEFTRSVIEQKHVRYVRGRPAKVLPEGGRLLIRAEDTLMGVPVEVRADAIVLASAVVPGRGTTQMAKLFNAKTDQYGFIDYETFHPVKAGDRLFFAGACGFPVDSLGAVNQGGAAAAEVIGLFKRDE